MEYLSHLTALVLCCMLYGAASQNCVDNGLVETVDIRIGTGNPSELPAEIGLPLVMTCVVELNSASVDSVPNVVSYIWTQNGVPRNEYNGQQVNIRAVVSSDGGDYRCRAVTELPCTTSESDTTTITTPPTVTLNPSSTIIVNEGERVEITCQSEGWPVPDIEWSRVTTQGGSVAISTSPVLVINSATLDDSTQYFCTATNSRDTARSVITVAVIELTDPPTQPPTTTGTTQMTGTGDGNVGGTGTGQITRPETEIGFYIGVAVTAFVCLALTIATVIFVIIWAVRKNKATVSAEELYEEEIVMEPIDEQQGNQKPVDVGWPEPSKKSRPKRKF